MDKHFQAALPAGAEIGDGPAACFSAIAVVNSSKDKPAILQIVPQLDAGGAERSTIDMAKAIAEAAFRSLVASEGGRLEPQLAAAGGELIRLPMNAKAPHTLLANGLRLAELVRRENVQLVHARSRAPAWSALMAARLAKVPLVTTYHGIYNASNALKRFYNSVMVRGDRVIANSQWTADHIVREHGVARNLIRVIPRGVVLMEFDTARVDPKRTESMRRQWGTGPADFVVLLPGRLTRWKGQLVLLAALAQMPPGSLHNVRAVLMGDAQGRDAYVQELRAAIAAANLDKVALIVGHATDMPAAYLASDVVVSASIEPEAFGRVAAEAGAMARPMIATDHGGARETILPGVSGQLVRPRDAAALAKAIGAVMEMSPSARAEMGEEARIYIRAHFSRDRMCAETLAVYRELLRV
jgi:glycosyltransferase involved in cell wall biosynthesis